MIFFVKTSFFEKLCGRVDLRYQIITHVSEDEMRKGWANGLAAFKTIRKKYLLYADFE